MCRLVHIGDSEFSDGVHEFFTTTKMGSSNNIFGQKNAIFYAAVYLIVI
jgi:hypothetical protein